MDDTNFPDSASGAGTTRRGFLGRGALAGLTLAAMGTSQHTAIAADTTAKPALDLYPGAVDATGNYVLPALPYAYDALEPHIDKETMTLHHDKHHAAYVKGLIEAEEGLAKARAEGNFDAINALTNKAAFNGGGHFLHCIFWANMAPEGKGGKPSEKLAAVSFPPSRISSVSSVSPVSARKV